MGEMRENPHYSPGTGMVHLGMTENGRLGVLKPLEAMQLWVELVGVLQRLPWSKLVVIPPEDGGLAQFKCPHCEKLMDEPGVEDWATRCTILDVNYGLRTVSSEYDGHGDYEGLWYSCSECALPVSLPEGWVET